MNYQKVYDELINLAQSKNRIKSTETYYERHHILPRCLGGKDEDHNLVLLTAREHYIAHKLLAKVNPNNKKLFYAWHCMAYRNSVNQNRIKVSSKDFQIIKEKFSKLQSERRKGKVHTKETKQKMSESSYWKGKTGPNSGKVFSKETKQKMSESGKNKVISKETRLKMSKGNKGKKRSESCKEKLRQYKGERASFYGKKHSQETLDKMKNNIPWNRMIIYNNKQYKAKHLAEFLNEKLQDLKIYKENGIWRLSQ